MKITKDRLKEIILEELNNRKQVDEQEMIGNVASFIMESKQHLKFSEQEEDKLEEVVQEGILDYFENRVEDFKKRLMEAKNIEVIKTILKEIK